MMSIAVIVIVGMLLVLSMLCTVLECYRKQIPYMYVSILHNKADSHMVCVSR